MCQFIWLSYCIFLTFYFISFPFVLFVLIFPYFLYYSSMLQLYFPSPFHFHPTDYIYYFLLGIPLCAPWCLLLFCKWNMCLIHFFFSCILCSTYVIWFSWQPFYVITFALFNALFPFPFVTLYCATFCFFLVYLLSLFFFFCQLLFLLFKCIPLIKGILILVLFLFFYYLFDLSFIITIFMLW